jgi:AcrR family transcriptional regulator
LLQLLEEKEYNSITVEDITERANLGRTTFYLHYRDKEELLLEEVIELIQELTQQIAGASISEWLQEGKPQASLVLLFQHIKANAHIYRLLLRGEGSLQSTERLGTIFINAVYKLSEIKGEVQSMLERSRVPLSFLGYYFSGALFATIIWWLDEELATSPEQIAALFQEIVLPGMGKIVR